MYQYRCYLIVCRGHYGVPEVKPSKTSVLGRFGNPIALGQSTGVAWASEVARIDLSRPTWALEVVRNDPSRSIWASTVAVSGALDVQMGRFGRRFLRERDRAPTCETSRKHGWAHAFSGPPEPDNDAKSIDLGVRQASPSSARPKSVRNRHRTNAK